MASIDTVVRARFGARGFAGPFAAVTMLGLAAACSSSSAGSGDGGPDAMTEAGATLCKYTVGPQTAPAATCASPGGAIPGADNNHCVVGGVQQAQATGACVSVGTDTPAAPSDSDAASDATGDGAAGGDDSGDDGNAAANCGETGYGVTNYGASAADDDCKYDVSWTSTPVCENGNVYFTVTAKKRTGTDGGPSLSDEPPLTGASVSAEVVNSDCVTIALNSGQTTVEDPSGDGVYKVGPIVFSKGGKWNVRFHFNECCSDDPVDSPHGHVAFWVNVP